MVRSVRTLRRRLFWLLLVIFLCIAVAAQRFMPPSLSKPLCDTYKLRVDPVVRTALGLDDGRGDTTAAADPIAIAHELPREIRVKIADGLQLAACAPATLEDPGRFSVVSASLVALPGAVGFAFILVYLIPAGTKRATRAAITNYYVPSGVSRVAPAPLAGPSGSELKTDMAILAVQVRLLHVALAYAVLSCLATLGFRPDFNAESFWGNPANRLHMAMLAAAGVLAAVWGAYPHASVGQNALALSARLGAGGVFCGGLIALLVAIPYRVVTTIDAARLERPDVQRFAFVRLVALPVAAWCVTFVVVAAIRWWRHVPLNLLPARGPVPGR